MTDHSNFHEVEVRPDGRYVCYNRILGSSLQATWLSEDKETDQDCSWTNVNLAGLASNEQEQIRYKTSVLTSVSHPAILPVEATWENLEKQKIVFITKFDIDNRTLRDFIGENEEIKLKDIKNWCRQILNALNYLHSFNPPIYHGGIRCDNIYRTDEEESESQIKLGIFNFELGEPEFIAPEMYKAVYTESADIFAFGMCVIEMVTKEIPYQEFNSAAQVWRAVCSGVKPKVLQQIGWEEVKQFIEICLVSREIRPTAKELLEHPFLTSNTENENKHRIRPEDLNRSPQQDSSNLISSFSSLSTSSGDFSFPERFSSSASSSITNSLGIPNHDSQFYIATTNPSSETATLLDSQSEADNARRENHSSLSDSSWEDSSLSLDIIVDRVRGPVASIILCVGEENIFFEFDFHSDSYETVAEKLIQDLRLPEDQTMKIAEKLKENLDYHKEVFINQGNYFNKETVTVDMASDGERIIVKGEQVSLLALGADMIAIIGDSIDFVSSGSLIIKVKNGKSMAPVLNFIENTWTTSGGVIGEIQQVDNLSDGEIILTGEEIKDEKNFPVICLLSSLFYSPQPDDSMKNELPLSTGPFIIFLVSLITIRVIADSRGWANYANFCYARMWNFLSPDLQHSITIKVFEAGLAINQPSPTQPIQVIINFVSVTGDQNNYEIAGDQTNVSGGNIGAIGRNAVNSVQNRKNSVSVNDDNTDDLKREWSHSRSESLDFR